MVRARIEQLLTSDPDFDAFCIDYFPLVYHRFTIGMERTTKNNLLLVHEKLDNIIEALDHMRSKYIVVRAVKPKPGWP